MNLAHALKRQQHRGGQVVAPANASTDARSPSSYNRSVPELPDLAILADAFGAALIDRPVLSAAALGPLTVRGTPTELNAFVGQRLRSFHRRGKFLWLDFERDRIAINAMLTGRLQLAASPKAAKQIECALEKTCMNAGNATDMPNLIPRHSAEISAVFDSGARLQWCLLPPAGKNIH